MHYLMPAAVICAGLTVGCRGAESVGPARPVLEASKRSALLQWRTETILGTPLGPAWGSDKRNIFALGSAGTVARFDGRRWRLEPSGTQATLTGLWGVGPQSVYAVGIDAARTPALVHYNGAVWTTQPAPGVSLLHAIWGTADADLWTVGLDEVWHYDGATWTLANDRIGSYYAAWGVGGMVFAVGGECVVLQSVADAWSSSTPADCAAIDQAAGSYIRLHGVWGAGPSDVFVAADRGLILHWDGTAWRGQPTGTPANLWAVWGTSAANVVAVGDGGTILHYNGTAWHPEASGTIDPLRGVWASGEAMFIVTAATGRILRSR